LHPHGQSVDGPGGDRDGRVAVNVGDDRQGTHVDEVGEPGGDHAEQPVGELRGEGGGEAHAAERAAEQPLGDGVALGPVDEGVGGAAGGGVGGEGGPGVGGGDDEVDLAERPCHLVVG